MKFLIAILGVTVIFALAYVGSTDKRNIKLRPIAVMMILQLFLAFALFNTQVGEFLVRGFAAVFEKLISYAMDGVGFVLAISSMLAKHPFSFPCYCLSYLFPY